MATEIATYLKYADLQMAQEAFLLPKTSAPGLTFTGALTIESCRSGCLARNNAAVFRFEAYSGRLAR